MDDDDLYVVAGEFNLCTLVWAWESLIPKLSSKYLNTQYLSELLGPWVNRWIKQCYMMILKYSHWIHRINVPWVFLLQYSPIFSRRIYWRVYSAEAVVGKQKTFPVLVNHLVVLNSSVAKSDIMMEHWNFWNFWLEPETMCSRPGIQEPNLKQPCRSGKRNKEDSLRAAHTWKTRKPRSEQRLPSRPHPLPGGESARGQGRGAGAAELTWPLSWSGTALLVGCIFWLYIIFY